MTEYQLGGALHYCLSGDHKCRLVAMRPALWHFAAACIEKPMNIFSYFQPKIKNTKVAEGKLVGSKVLLSSCARDS